MEINCEVVTIRDVPKKIIFQERKKRQSGSVDFYYGRKK